MNLPTKLDIYFKRWGNRCNDCFRIYLYSRVFTICNHEMRPWSIDFWQGNRTYKCYWQNHSFDKKIQHSNYRQKIQFLSNPARMSKRNLHVTLCSVLSKTWDNNPPPPPQSRKTVLSRKQFFSTHRARNFLSGLLDKSPSWPSGMARNGPVLNWLEECSWNVANLEEKKENKNFNLKTRTSLTAVFLVAQTKWLIAHLEV